MRRSTAREEPKQRTDREGRAGDSRSQDERETGYGAHVTTDELQRSRALRRL